MLRLALLAPIGLLLASCGLEPMYGGGGEASVARSLAAVDVPAIPGRAGWLLRGELQQRMGAAGNGEQRYRLDVRLDDSLEGLGLLNDDTISRERRILRARYQLIDAVDGAILLDATAEADSGIDVVSSEYATIAAEQSAMENLTREVADRMVTRVALTLRALSAEGRE